VVVQGYLAYSALEQQEDDLVDQIVENEGRQLVDRIAAGEHVLIADGKPRDLTTRSRAWLVPPRSDDHGGHDPAARHPPGVPALADGLHIRRVDERELHYLVAPTPAGRLFLEYDASVDEAFVYRFGVYLLITGALFTVLAALVSLTIARLVVAPFRRLALHLSQWTPGAPPRLVGRSDEETLLLEAFDAAQRRLDESHAREREFAANVRHEIRTPLTALRTDAEMLLLTQSLDDAGRQRLLRMQATVDAVAADIESVHNLSKARLGQREAINLADCVADVWAGLQHHNASGQVTLQNLIPRHAAASVDRLGLMTILRNLLRNVIDHAAPGRCRVEWIHDGLRLSDEGPGIAAADLPRIFDRHFSRTRTDLGADRAAAADSAPERGLGLAIARQTAVAHDWSLEVRSTVGRGTTFTLIFDETSTNA
ncbi:MAG: sensor histidine kinase, partial [Lautropia sp.]